MSTDHSDSAKSQCAAIYERLRQGATLTSLEALRLFGCMRLASRIDDLRRSGASITTTMVKEGGKRFARYSMPRTEGVAQ